MVSSLLGIANQASIEDSLFSSAASLLAKDDYKKADQIFTKLVGDKPDCIQFRELCCEIAKEYNNKLFYDLSINYASRGLSICDSITDKFKQELIEVIIVNHLDMGNYTLAQDFYTRLNEIPNKSDAKTASYLNLKGEIERLSGNSIQAISSFNSAIVLNKRIGNTHSLVINFNNIGLCYLELNKFDSSIHFLNASQFLIDSIGLEVRKQAIGVSFGKHYQKLGDYAKALKYFTSVLNYDVGNHPDGVELLRDAYRGIAQCNEQLSNYRQAFTAQEKEQFYTTKIVNYNMQAAIYQEQILSDRTEHQQELNSLKKEIALEKKYNQAVLVILITILLIIALLLYSLWLRHRSTKQRVELEMNKNKIQELELEKLNVKKEQLELEINKKEQLELISKLERERLQEKIDSKNRELTTTAIHISNKNEALAEIQTRIIEIEKNAPDALNLYLKKVQHLIKDNLQLDSDWVVFRKHFTEVHPMFFNKLTAKYPELTSDELKLCAYLKIQLSSKEIARILNITTAAVNKRRNRVRKKFDLSPEVDLYEFLIKIN